MAAPGEAGFASIVAEHGWRRVAILCLAVWLHAADSLLAATVMPSAVVDIGGLALIYWTIAVYELGSILAGFAAGVMTARFSLRAGMGWAAGVYGVGCLASAAAPDMDIMLVGRTLQGLGGGWLVALAHVGTAQMLPAHHWPRLLAMISAVWGASALVGPLIGGAFHPRLLARRLPRLRVQAAIFAGLVLMLPRDRPAVEVGQTLPWRRLGLIACGVLAVLIAGVRPDPLAALVLLSVGAALFALVLRLDAAGAHRLLPERPFSLRAPWGLGFLMVLTLSAVTVSFTVYGPLVMERLFGASPLTAGFMIAVESVAWSAAAIGFAGAGRRLEPWLIRLGALLVVAGTAGFAATMPHGPLAAVLPSAVVQGAGFGMCWAFVMRRIVESVAEGDRERASSAVPAMQMMGYALGAALAGIVANAAGLADGADPVAVRRTAFWVFAAFLPIGVVGLAAAWRLARSGPARLSRAA